MEKLCCLIKSLVAIDVFGHLLDLFVALIF